MSASSPEELPGWSRNLNFLIETERRRGTSTAELMEGYRVSRGQVSNLRSGKSRNPSAALVGRVAAYHGVPVDFFFDEEVRRQVVAERDY